MKHDIPKLDAAGMRRFGLTTGAIVAALFGLGFPWLLDRPLPPWPFVLGAVLALWALVHPRSLEPVYLAWMKLGLLLNRITTPIILGTLFFLVFTPIASVMRLFGRDPMHRKRYPGAESYRHPSRDRPQRHMEKPY